jgi:hypothetical protein
VSNSKQMTDMEYAMEWRRAALDLGAENASLRARNEHLERCVTQVTLATAAIVIPPRRAL